MQFVQARQRDPQYLKTLAQQREIVIEEQQRKNTQLTRELASLTTRLAQHERQSEHKQQAHQSQLINLKTAMQHLQIEVESLKHENSQYEFNINIERVKNQELTKESKNHIDKVKMDADTQRDNLKNKISKLEANLHSLKSYYHVDDRIEKDKKVIIEDANRDLRGFSNENQQRMIVLQNQQLTNEIEYQSKQIISLLEKNEKQQQELKNMKSELDLHKSIENDLIKRSSLAQALIKQLNVKIKGLEANQKNTDEKNLAESTLRSQMEAKHSVHSELSDSEVTPGTKTMEFNKLKFEYAQLRNYNNYLQNMQGFYNQKYQTLATILVEYLEAINFFKKEEGVMEAVNQETSLNLLDLKTKPVKEWKAQEMQAIIYMLLGQIKPYLSKNSLTSFPEMKNINITFIDDSNKEPLALPKIVENYEKITQNNMKKMNNRFKDIPVDISTKIIRSNLRDWGKKIDHGSLPRNKKSHSFMLDQTPL